VEEFCTTKEAPYDNMAHAHCMLDNQGYKDNIFVANMAHSHFVFNNQGYKDNI
jgi:hypothetical protein